MKTTHTVLTLLVSGFLVLPADLLAAEDAEDSNRASNIEAEYELVGYFQSDDSFRFGKFSGLTDEHWEPVLNFRIESRPAWDSEDPTSWEVQGWRLGLDSMRLKFDYRDQGTQRFTLDYREIPNNRFNDAMTPFNGVGTGMLSLPANWVGTPNQGTDGFATLHENLKPLAIGWDRKRLALNFDRAINRDWSFDVNWRRDSKDGLQTFGAVIGNSGGNPRTVVLPFNMDWETDVMEASFNFANRRYQFGAALYMSWFDNGQKSVTWDNPFGLRSGWDESVGFPTGQGLYSLPPDNEAVQFRLYGGVNFDNGSRLSGDFSFGTMEQDDMLFAYSVNPALEVHTPLPRNFMDAQIDTTFANIRYTARPTDRLSVLAAYTLDDRDNKTPRDEWVYIGGDSQDQKDEEDARINLPYSYERKEWDLSATWRATRSLRVKSGLEFKDYSRTYSEVLDSDETRYFAGLSMNNWEKASLSVDFESSERDIDHYEGNRPLILSHLPGAIEEDEYENAPAMRKYNQTDRERDEYRFRADFFPTTMFNFALSGSWSEDDYNDDKSLLGLQNAEVTTWSLDFGVYPVDGFSVTAYYTIQQYDSLIRNRTWRGNAPGGALDPDRDFTIDLEDDVDTWNIALNWERPGDSGRGGMEFGIDFTSSDASSDYVLGGPAASDSPALPTLKSDLRSWTVHGSYALNERSSVRLAFEKQKLSSTDFALDNIDVDSTSVALLLGNSAANYDLSLLMLSYMYRYK